MDKKVVYSTKMDYSTDFSFSLGPEWHGNWPAGTVERNRRLYDFELVWFRTGHARIITPSHGIYPCPAGSLIIIPPGIVHCTVADGPVERWCIHFDWFHDCPAHKNGSPVFLYEDEQETFSPEQQAAFPRLPGISFPFFSLQAPYSTEKLIRRFFEQNGTTPFLIIEKTGILSQLLGMVMSQNECQPMKNLSPDYGRIFLAAKNYLDCHFTSPSTSVRNAASVAGISSNWLCKIFRKITGASVMNYLAHLRLEHAISLLKAGNTVQEAALASGFSDPNYFIRYFKKKNGITPSVIRRAPGNDAL